MLRCKDCEESAHQSCYGVRGLPPLWAVMPRVRALEETITPQGFSAPLSPPWAASGVPPSTRRCTGASGSASDCAREKGRGVKKVAGNEGRSHKGPGAGNMGREGSGLGHLFSSDSGMKAEPTMDTGSGVPGPVPRMGWRCNWCKWRRRCKAGLADPLLGASPTPDEPPRYSAACLRCSAVPGSWFRVQG